MNHKHMIAAAFVAAALVNMPASAATTVLNLTGSGVSVSIELTYDVNPKAGGPLGSSPNIFDPIGSFVITGATGSFSDANIGVAATITGIVPSNPSNPEPTNLLAPASFGHYLVANGVPGPGGLAPGFSYDNLFYPGGSPQTASDYPFHGGFLDIYGLVFTTTGGLAVNLWSNGDFGRGATYGAGVTDGLDVLDYLGGLSLAAVPEPGTWILMIGGFALVGASLRHRKTAVSFA